MWEWSTGAEKRKEDLHNCIAFDFLNFNLWIEIMFNWKKRDVLLEHSFSVINKKKITSTAILSITNVSIINHNTAVFFYLFV